MTALNTRFQNDVVSWSSIGNISLAIWNRPPTLEALAKVHECTLQLIRENPAGIACLVVSRAATPPEKQVADLGSQQVVQIQDKVLALAAVQEQNGILSALVRVTLQTMMALGIGKSPFPKKMFATPEEAIGWLDQTLAPGKKLLVERTVLAREVETARSAYRMVRA